MGTDVGRGVGFPAEYVGCNEGVTVGEDVGDELGLYVGLPTEYVGDILGDSVGTPDGEEVGGLDG